MVNNQAAFYIGLHRTTGVPNPGSQASQLSLAPPMIEYIADQQ